MGKDKALGFFTAVPKVHNCAQAVTDGFDRHDLMDEMSSSGGGRAPGGMCGAIYAALALLPEEKRDEALAEFVKRTGSSVCREIKSIYKTPCAECVAAASDILESHAQTQK